MPVGVPPPPLNSPNGSYYWLEWYTNLTNFLNGTNIPWANLNFTNSNIADILTRDHNELTNIQGGNASGTRTWTGNAWHMTGRGVISSAGVGTGFPASWTISGSSGSYTIVHNLNLASPQLGAMVTSNTSGVTVQYVDCSSTSQVVVHLSGAGACSVIILT